MQGERKACGAATFIIAVVYVFFNSMLQMKLFNKMFISLYVIVMKLSGERETVRCAVTTYAVECYRLSPLLPEANFYYFHSQVWYNVFEKYKREKTNSIYYPTNLLMEQ